MCCFIYRCLVKKKGNQEPLQKTAIKNECTKNDI